MMSDRQKRVLVVKKHSLSCLKVVLEWKKTFGGFIQHREDAPTVLAIHVKPTCEIPLPLIYNQCSCTWSCWENTKFDVIGQLQPCAVYKDSPLGRRSADSLRAQRRAERRTPVTDAEWGQREKSLYRAVSMLFIDVRRQAAPHLKGKKDVVGFGKRTTWCAIGRSFFFFFSHLLNVITVSIM